MGPVPATFCLGWLGTLVEETPWWGIVIGAALLLFVAYLLRYYLIIRLPVWLATRTCYRLRVHGRQNVPAKGGALLVCNHVSHIDSLLLLGACPRRIRFLVWAPFVRSWIMRPFMRVAKVIPIDPNAGPRAILQSLRAASDALAQGDLVLIFAEGGLTRTGFMLPFARGFEQVVKRCPVPIIPVSLDNVWGSIFSYQGGRFFWKWPRRLPYPVSVSFGEPLPPTASAVEVRQAIQKLSADAAILRGDRRVPVHRQFVRQAVRHPFRPCLFDTTNPAKPMYRYGEVLAGAKILRKRLRPILGDAAMVGLWIPPSAGGAIANIALSLLGKTAVNLNYTSGTDSIHSALRQCGIRHVLTSRLFTSKMKLDLPDGVEAVYLDDFRKTVTKWERLRAFLSVLLCRPFPFVQERWVLGLGRHTCDDLATVIFSSGSTGEPKGVMLTHGNVAANIESMVQAIDLVSRDRIMGILPFFHSFGYSVTLWGPLQVGASAGYYPDPRQAKEIGELMKKWACTIYLSTPTFLRFCLRRCEPDDFKTLRLLVCGAEKLPQSLAADFKERFGVEPLEGYGCTELSPVVSTNVPNWEQGEPKQVGNKPGTIGHALPGVAVRVVDPDTGAPLPPGEQGLLLVYGANVMKGYLGKPELTAEVLKDGWYATGDLAKYDEDGFLTITDRLSRFSKIGGEMVPHGKIEDHLHQIVSTTEQTFVVTAVPDEGKGERLVVLHVALGEKDVRHVHRELTGCGLPNLWVPRERDFFQIPELPVLGSGKVDLRRVKELALEKAKAG